MNVLSLFDGMSCGMIALDRADIKVDNYYASEIDKYAMQVSKDNYPQIQQLGSIIDLTREELLALGPIDVLIGGSPCQGFSVAGKMKGSQTKEGIDVTSLAQYLELKELGFEFDGQSYLFWEYVRVWKIVKPKYFFLENVRVTKKWLPMFNEAMGVEPIMINSALVSAQNRQRYYWTNIPSVTQPEDRGILLKDIIETGVVDRNKSYCIDANYWKGTTIEQYIKKARRQVVFEAQAFTERRTEEAKRIRREYREKYGRDFSPRRGKEMVLRDDGKMNCLTATYSMKEHVLIDETINYRKLTPIECERLQTVPDNYTQFVSNSQRYRMLGNGWTVDVVAHIFKNLK